MNPNARTIQWHPQRTLSSLTFTVSVFTAISLVAWGASPYSSFLHHDVHSSRGVPDLMFVLGWLLMCVAMMLPTALPLLAALERVVADRSDAPRALVMASFGFLGVWLLFGVIARLEDVLLHALVDSSLWLSTHPRVITASLLTVAGAYQLSPLAAKCASACRSPFGFIARGWTGQRDLILQAARIGVAYGLSCFGCCWPLMAVMFAVGMTNLAWMFALTLVMLAQKHSQHGLLVLRLSGVGFLSVALAVSLNVI
jgi:predicted metal-binding membrane protein